MDPQPRSHVIDRRHFVGLVGRWGLGVVALGGAVPALLAACSGDDDTTASAGAAATTTPAPEPTADVQASESEGTTQGTAIVGDVVDFALTSDQWAGPFGFVTLRLHRALVDGNELFHIRTDASERDYAREHGLVNVPKIAVLAGTDMVAKAYFPAGDDDQPTLVATQPGRDNHTSAWHVHTYAWVDEPQPVQSVADLEAAADAGAVEIEETQVVLNASAVVWSDGQLPVVGWVRQPAGARPASVQFSVRRSRSASRSRNHAPRSFTRRSRSLGRWKSSVSETTMFLRATGSPPRLRNDPACATVAPTTRACHVSGVHRCVTRPRS